MEDAKWAILKEKWPLWNNIQRRLFTYWFFYTSHKSFIALAEKYMPDIAISKDSIFDLPFEEGLEKCTTDHDMQDLVSLLSYELKTRK